MIQSIQSGKPIYINNLNWDCKFNYIVFQAKGEDTRTAKPWNGNCTTYEDFVINNLDYPEFEMNTDIVPCESMFKNYYCDLCSKENKSKEY